MVGSCDLYTTKAAGGDKKLYKDIEHNLESQYESLLRFSVSLSRPEVKNAGPVLNLSRSSPFGSLSQISSRRAFAYIIATLNASHPDYEFSHLLQPSDFRLEKSLKQVMNTFDSTLYNLRPKPVGRLQKVPDQWPQSTPAVTGARWSPKMWRIIDKEMHLKQCSIYTYAPEEDLWEGEEGLIWSLHYFFFNKVRKRVCYVYLRGASLSSSGGSSIPQTPVSPFVGDLGDFETLDDLGARKRANYWLGEQAARNLDVPDEVGSDDEPRLLSSKERTFVRTADESGSPVSDV